MRRNFFKPKIAYSGPAESNVDLQLLSIKSLELTFL